MTDAAPDGLPREQPRRALVGVARTLRVAASRFQRDDGFDKASALAYSSLLAIVPAALLAISLVDLLDFERRVAMTDRVLEMIFPTGAAQVRQGFHDYLEESRAALQGPTSSAMVRIVSLLTLVYFAGQLLQTVDRVVSAVWGGGGLRRFFKRLSAYWAVITLGPLLLALSFTATAVAGEFLGPAIGAILARLLPFGVTWFAVFLFFRLMPHSTVRTRAAVAGAVVTGTLWESSKILLGWYMSRPATFLTTLSFFPAAILWMYVSWVIAMYGLEVAYVVQHRSWRAGSAALPGPRQGAARDALAVAVMIEVALAFDDGRAPDRAEVAERLGVPDDEAADAIAALETAGLVVDAGGGWRPARGAAGILARDAVGASRGEAGAALSASGAPARRTAVAWVEQLDREGHAACGAVTIADLVREARRTATCGPASGPSGVSARPGGPPAAP